MADNAVALLEKAMAMRNASTRSAVGPGLAAESAVLAAEYLRISRRGTSSGGPQRAKPAKSVVRERHIATANKLSGTTLLGLAARKAVRKLLRLLRLDHTDGQNGNQSEGEAAEEKKALRKAER